GEPEPRPEDEHEGHAAEVNEFETEGSDASRVGEAGEADEHERAVGGGAVAHRRDEPAHIAVPKEVPGHRALALVPREHCGDAGDDDVDRDSDPDPCDVHALSPSMMS